MCDTEDNVVRLCQEHIDEMVAAFYAKYPGIEAYHQANKDRCSHCVEYDMNEQFGAGAGYEWRSIEWLL